MTLKRRRIVTVANADRGDRCGCAIGARFLGVMLVASAVWYGWHWQESMLSPGVSAAHILGLSFTAAIIGKLVGILHYKYRNRMRENHT